MVTTFIRSTDNCSGQVWRFLEMVSQAVSDVQLEHPTLQKKSNFCSRKVSIYVHQSLYLVLKGTAEWRLSSVLASWDIFKTKYFEAFVDSEYGLWVRMTLKFARVNMKGLRDPSKCENLVGGLSNHCENVVAVQETHFICAADSRMLENDCRLFSIRQPL